MPRIREHLTVEVFEYQCGPEHSGGHFDDLVQRRPAHAQCREGFVCTSGVVDLGVLLGDDAPVHLFGDVDEAHAAAQHDDGQSE